jgi:GNAT superfamily N-acetyltransferase
MAAKTKEFYIMDIQIRKLTPELVDDYLHFFDTTPHDDAIDEHKCYCVCWANNDSNGKDFSTAEKRRSIASQYVKDDNIKGYLAYVNGKAVGWCNANTRSECMECDGGRRYFIDPVFSDKNDDNIKIKSIFCFVIAPEMRRKGISKMLLERVCNDAVLDGFAYIEAYPNKEFVSEQYDFVGPKAIYEKYGFYTHHEWPDRLIMRKKLGENK